MAFSKNRRLADLVSSAGEVSSFVDASVTHADLHTSMDLTGKTVTVANASTGDSDTTAANTAFVQQEIAALVDSAPGTLNTLNELAAALGDDASFSTTVTNSIATKLPLAGGTMTGDLVLKSDGGENVINVVHSGNTAQIVSIGQSGDNSGNGVIQLRRNNGTVHSQIHSHGSTYFNGGNVGIGFASGTPFGKLHVEDTGWSSGSPYGAVAYIQGGAVNDLNWGHLLISQSGTTTDTGGRLAFGANGGNPIAGIRAKYKGATYGDLAFLTRPSGGTNTQRMVIDSSGNVGIGNSNPSRALLHVGGDGIALNTTQDVSKTAILRTSGGGNYSTSGNGSAAHALTLMRGNNAADGDQVGLSFVLDNGNWSATSEIMAEVEQASSANTRLNFKTWNATGAMRTTSYITSEGQVVKPYQSAFVAVRDSAQSIAVNQNVVFNNAYKNIGSDYNTSNGSYMAPISGFYFFSYTILLQNITSTFHIDHYLRTSNHSFIGGMPGRIEYQAAGSGTWGDGYIGFGHAQTVYMDAGDTAHVDFSELGGATRSVYGNSGNNWTKFTGYFLG